jgi:hypothetical protein
MTEKQSIDEIIWEAKQLLKEGKTSDAVLVLRRGFRFVSDVGETAKILDELAWINEAEWKEKVEKEGIVQLYCEEYVLAFGHWQSILTMIGLELEKYVILINSTQKGLLLLSDNVHGIELYNNWKNTLFDLLEKYQFENKQDKVEEIDQLLTDFYLIAVERFMESHPKETLGILFVLGDTLRGRKTIVSGDVFYKLGILRIGETEKLDLGPEYKAVALRKALESFRSAIAEYPETEKDRKKEIRQKITQIEAKLKNCK